MANDWIENYDTDGDDEISYDEAVEGNLLIR